jgi:hypothetical protein
MTPIGGEQDQCEQKPRRLHRNVDFMLTENLQQPGQHRGTGSKLPNEKVKAFKSAVALSKSFKPPGRGDDEMA